MLEELNISFTFNSSTIAELQKIASVRKTNIQSLEKTQIFEDSIRRKVSTTSLASHSTSKQNLERLQNIYYIGNLFKTFFQFLDSSNAESIKNVPNIVFNIVTSNESFKKQFSEVVKSRLDQWKQRYDQKMLPELLQSFERCELPLKKDAKNKTIGSTDKQLFSDYLKVEAKLRQAYKFIQTRFTSTFFDKLLHKTQEAIRYHFLEKGSELNRVQEPTWMFNYIGEIVDSNVKFALRILDLDRATCSFILQVYFETIVQKNVFERFKADIIKIGDQLDLIFNFVDHLLALQHDIRSRYEPVADFCQGCLLDRMIHTFEKDQFLEKLLTYQANCFESKVFRDFFYINYTKINLKNIQAFNITQNFNLMLDKLYGKYFNCSSKAKDKVNNTYYQIIDSMSKHLVTCFDRVYSNNDEKLQILNVFRRVEDQFQNHLQRYKAQLPDLEKSIQRLHLQMEKEFIKLAEQMLMPINKKISKAVIDCPLTDGKLTSSQLDLGEFMAYYKSWKAIVDKLNQIYFYRDMSLVRVFFLFLDEIKFKKDGLMVLVEAFEPFLKDIYTPEKYRLLKLLFFMENYKKIEILSERTCITRTFLPEQYIAIIIRLDYSL